MNIALAIAAIALASAIVGLGVASANMLFEASERIYESGFDLMFLRSVGGETVAEAYYQEIGRYGVAHSKFYKGLAYLALMISIALSGIIILLIPRISRVRVPSAPIIEQPSDSSDIDPRGYMV